MNFKKLLNLYHFNGTLNRLEYLFVAIMSFVIVKLIPLEMYLLNLKFVLALCLVLTYFMLTAGIKRLRDAGKPWWILFIPIYNYIILLTHPTKLVNANESLSLTKNKMSKQAKIIVALVLVGSIYGVLQIMNTTKETFEVVKLLNLSQAKSENNKTDDTMMNAIAEVDQNNELKNETKEESEEENLFNKVNQDYQNFLIKESVQKHLKLMGALNYDELIQKKNELSKKFESYDLDREKLIKQLSTTSNIEQAKSDELNNRMEDLMSEQFAIEHLIMNKENEKKSSFF